MKLFPKALMFAFLSLFLMTSCSDDDDDDSPSSKTSVNGESSVSLTKGVLESSGKNSGNNSYAWVIALFSEGISYNAGTEEYSGQGDILSLGLITNNPNGLQDGDYSPSTQGGAFTFVIALLYKNVSPQTGQSDYKTNLTSGKVSITGSNDNDNEVTIKYNLQNATSDTTISGTFTGILTKAD